MPISKASKAARKRLANRIKAQKADITTIADFLEANGWRVAVIGPAQVYQGSAKLNFELRVGFTGIRKQSS